MVLFIISLAAFEFFSLYDFFLNESEYRFGTEIAGLRYQSATYFIGLSVVNIFVLLLAGFGVRLLKTERGCLVCRSALFSLSGLIVLFI